MRDETMPNYSLEGFGVRRYAGSVGRRYQNHTITGHLGVAAITADDAKYFAADFFDHFDGGDKVRADVPFNIAAAH